jgi:hypothetical protein
MADREKLVEIISDYFGVDPAYFDVDPFELADHLLANGTKVLPCNLGDEFWTEWVGIRKAKCSMLTQKADGTWTGRFTVENSRGSSVTYPLSEIGKKLFLTREEAEEAYK